MLLSILRASNSNVNDSPTEPSLDFLTNQLFAKNNNLEPPQILQNPKIIKSFINSIAPPKFAPILLDREINATVETFTEENQTEIMKCEDKNMQTSPLVREIAIQASNIVRLENTETQTEQMEEHKLDYQSVIIMESSPQKQKSNSIYVPNIYHIFQLYQ